MSQTNLRYILALCCSTAILTACPGDDAPEVTTVNESTTSGTDGPSTVTVNPTTVTVTDGPTTTEPGNTTEIDPDTTAGPGSATDSSDGGSTGTTGGTESGSTAAESSSGESGSSGTTGGDSAFDCDDVDLGSAVPLTEMGNNMGFGDDFMASCAINGANDEDVLYEWTAPADGTYVFDTIGSPLDTILTLLSACDGTELECNDDLNGDVFQSAITRTMTAGESVLISVDGWNATGDFELHIYEEPAGWGDCAMGSPIYDCLPEEVCLVDNAMAPTIGVCAEFGCAVAGDCPALPPGGTAVAACVDVTGDMVAAECIISCAGGATCPTGMDCFMSAICVWPA